MCMYAGEVLNSSVSIIYSTQIDTVHTRSSDLIPMFAYHILSVGARVTNVHDVGEVSINYV